MIFDLWNTLADWPVDVWAEVRPRIAERLGLTPEAFDEQWYGELYESREMGPLGDAFAHFGADSATAAELVELRRGVTKRGLVPVPGAVETLTELRRRGFQLGLITVCSDDVPEAWPDTSFHGLFDAEVFSCTVGLRKPDPRIYLLACEQLKVEPQDAVFVGDGANDELGGAERVGMTAVLLERPGEELRWDGLRIRSLPEVLSIVEKED